MRPRLAVLLLLTAVRAARRPFVPKECGDVCHHGKCLFQGCRDAPNCPGGMCRFEDCVSPSCEGGACIFVRCVDPTCPGGSCKFEDLLMGTAKHPAMLFYLDNHVSQAPMARAPLASAKVAPAGSTWPSSGVCSAASTPSRL